MISFEQSTATTMILYGAGTLIGIIGMMARLRWVRMSAAVLIIIGFLVQTVSMILGSHGAIPGGLSWGAYLQILAWFVVLCGIAGLWKMRSSIPLLFITPWRLILFPMSCLFLHLPIQLP